MDFDSALSLTPFPHSDAVVQLASGSAQSASRTPGVLSMPHKIPHTEDLARKPAQSDHTARRNVTQACSPLQGRPSWKSLGATWWAGSVSVGAADLPALPGMSRTLSRPARQEQFPSDSPRFYPFYNYTLRSKALAVVFPKEYGALCSGCFCNRTGTMAHAEAASPLSECQTGENRWLTLTRFGRDMLFGEF